MRALSRLLANKIENMSAGERHEINSALLPATEPAPPSNPTSATKETCSRDLAKGEFGSTQTTNDTSTISGSAIAHEMSASVPNAPALSPSAVLPPRAAMTTPPTSSCPTHNSAASMSKTVVVR